MSHGSYDASYMVSDENSPAYTWTSEPIHMSYRTPPMPSLVSYKAWDAGSSPEQDTTILHSPPMTYDSPPLTFSHDLTSEALVAEQTTTAITLDEHCYASPENLPNRDALKAARRVARRPNPVAIPNLTKKARGRPVPTKDTLLKPGSGRAYACPVQDCRKVFTRAEHLKRHTRSIHTNEKPFKCEEPGCGRLFTRHDNLLQHIKNHRSSPPIRDVSAEYGPLDRVRITRSSSAEDQSHVSPSMGVLIPPSISAIPSAFGSQAMQQEYEIADYRGTLSPEVGDPPSPESSPAPSEPSYMNYSYGCPWPQSDIRSIPSSTYTMTAESRYPQSTLISATGAYAFQT